MTPPHTVVHAAHLFVPAVRPDLASKAAGSAATAVILDLEDSVPVEQKARARDALGTMAETLAAQGKHVMVRPNNEPDLLFDDVDAALDAGVRGIVLPKTESVDQLHELDEYLRAREASMSGALERIGLELQIESARGLLDAPRLSEALERTQAMMLGVEDFGTDLGVDPQDPEGDLRWAHGQLLLAATASGVWPYGLIGAFSDFRDLEAYARAVRMSRAFGYVGAYCIHPRQAEIAATGFRPDEEKVRHARRVVDAFDRAEAQGRSACSLDGAMVDLPVVERARRLLRRAGEDT
ncbi:hypothetical protein BHE97_17725 [Aeromicrobium sp. PE09-221]|uniref:HpcH/HpaI aldolase/citrate lyase family protein n=1 Tax=Aeromicrobium sp. PE09-221 TaxID=1898043 RepID=UPI000B3E85DE|nr:CoA ester lyase [Aeromicrobium sp. PE09-221]OUZ07338.1 hypothetical protein BHE97_17725 [Aeromicrobium sp. PE09-221]